ncbi:unnamed protein product [Effrenium voratum]|nr:unnamed protein product [Effrenium voratum]
MKPHIKLSQVVARDGTTSMFECLLCRGLAWEPQVVMCCQKVFCGGCLDDFLSTGSSCPSCQASLVVRDGSTGGCTEQTVKRLEKTAEGVKGVAWRVYTNINVRCGKSCTWYGNILAYSDHMNSCQVGQEGILDDVTQRAHASGQDSQSQVQDDMRGIHVVAGGHSSSDPNQLNLRVGDKVNVQQVAGHGWAFGILISGQSGSQGWFPTHCLLPQRQHSPPEQSPPPSAPPSSSVKVERDYTASDSAQLSVKEGELVYVKQKDQTGWTWVARVNPQVIGQREGWVPDWLLQKDLSHL